MDPLRITLQVGILFGFAHPGGLCQDLWLLLIPGSETLRDAAMLILWGDNLSPAEWTLAEGHRHMVNGRAKDLLLLQVEALGMTGFEVAAWLETRNIFLELATRDVSLPDAGVRSALHAVLSGQEHCTSTSGTVSDASASPGVVNPRERLAL